MLVEDDAGYAQLLQMMLEEIGINRVKVAMNYEQGLKCFKEYNPNVCLFDIDLGPGKKTGIDLAVEIRKIDASVPIVYLTSNFNNTYYERSKHTRPSSFMNKELSRLKLHQAIELALLQLENNQVNPITSSAPNYPTPVPYINNTHFFFKVGDVYKNIATDNISFFFANGKMTYAKVETRSLPTSVHLKTLEEELFPKFIRIHRSFLVNIAHITLINAKEDKVQVEGESLPIGYNYRKGFFEQLKLLK